MAQDFSDDSYDPDHIADTDMENQEKNDLALKSSFAGAASPPNRVDGMPWCDTTNGLLKMSYSGSLKTIFDLVNNRALVALLATNCSRSILAGAGLSGGGELNANRTLTHTAHTGEVTGQTALTIANDIITPAKCYPGTLMAAEMSQSSDAVSLGGASWSTVISFPLKCPSGATVLRLYARIKNELGSSQCRLNTPFATSSPGVDVGATYSWVNCGTASMAAGVAGTVYTINIQGYSPSYQGYIQGYRIWWE